MSRPTGSPSLQPTSRIIASKSRAPVTHSPSSVAPSSGSPSSAPTLSEEKVLKNLFQNELVNISINSTVIYQDIILKGSSIVGGCNPWLIGTGSALGVTSTAQRTLSISLLTYDGDIASRSSVHCYNGTIATEIVSAMSTLSTSSLTCDNHIWKSKKCLMGFLSVCIDCADPCVVVDCPSLVSINPCGLGGNIYGCVNTTLTVNAYRILSARFVPFSVIPSIKRLSYTSQRTSVTVSAILSKDGTVYCSAFALGVTPVSTAVIILGLQSAISISKIASVSVIGLEPFTSYDIYCVTASDLGDTMSLADSLQSKLAVKSACCKTISVSLSINSLFIGTSSVNTVLITVDAPPSDFILLRLGTSYTAVPQTVTQLVPYSLLLSSGSNQLKYFYSISSSSSQLLGNITIVPILAGPSVSEYTIVYPFPQIITVISSTTAPPTPRLISVQFSNSGSQLLVFFDTDTNKGNETISLFPCSNLFSFIGVAYSICQWSSLSSVDIELGSAATVEIGSTFILLDNLIKAACVSNVAECGTWKFAPRMSLTVGAPSSAIVPQVRIFAPSILGACDSFSLDLSSSTGNCGRQWANVSFIVTSSNPFSAALIAATQSFLNKNYVTSGPPISLKRGSFPSGLNNIVLVLCNFLNRCGSGSMQLIRTNDSSPVVVIASDERLSLTTLAGLDISANAYVNSCDGGVTRANLIYIWSAYKGGIQNFSLISTSKQNNTFRLSPYTLSVGTPYTIKLTVLDTLSHRSSTGSITVNIIPSNLVAIISGGSYKNVLQFTSILLDASSSYDRDQFGISGLAAGLSFLWTCVQTEPTISSSCPLSFTSLKSPTLTAYAGDSSASTVSALTVTVFDATRSATSTVYLTVQAVDKPLVIITSSFGEKVNPGKALTIAGAVTLTSAGQIEWTVNDTSIALPSKARSPTKYNVIPGSNFLELAIIPNSLPFGSVLLFTLSCTQGSFISSASIIVVINAPPQPGIFFVTPLSGYELSTTFTMSASLWTDTDLPLAYSFGYIAISGHISSVRGLSSISYTGSYLPSGLDTANFNVSCLLQVFDSYLADTMSLASVRVFEVVSNSSSLQTFFNKGRSDNGKSSTSEEVLTVVLDKMNKQPCINAPNCNSLNRRACSITKNTCGPCFDKFTGDPGDQNTKCISSSKLTMAAAITTGSTCLSTSSCIGYSVCVNSMCVTPSKDCINKCNLNGVCSFVSSDTGRSVPTCLVGNPNCKAVCTCNVGFNGTFCDVTSATFIANQQLKYLLALSLSQLTVDQDASLDTVTSYISSAASLTQNYGELSSNSTQLLAIVINSILSQSALLSLPYDSISNVLSAIDGIVLALLKNGGTAALTVTTSSLLQSYSNLVLSQMVNSQFDVSALYESFRSLNSVQTVSNGAITLMSSVTSQESLVGLQPNSISLQTASDITNVKLGMVVMRSLSLGSSLASKVHSDPLIVTLPDLTVCASSGCGFTVIMQTVDNATYIDGSSTVKAFTTACNSTAYHMTYQCANGLNVTNVCHGKPSTVTNTCPYLLTKPTCGRILSSVTADDVCTMVSYTGTSTTCQCTVPNSYFSSRRLQSAFPNSFTDGIATIGGTLVLATITNARIISPPTSSPTLAPIVISSHGNYLSELNVIITVLVTVFVTFGALFALLCYCNTTKEKPWFPLRTTRKTGISPISSADSENFNGLDEDLEGEAPVIPRKSRTRKYDEDIVIMAPRGPAKPREYREERSSVIMDYPMFASDDDAVEASFMMNTKGQHRSQMTSKRAQPISSLSPKDELTLKPVGDRRTSKRSHSDESPSDELTSKPGKGRSPSIMHVASEISAKPMSVLMMPRGDYSGRRLAPIVSLKPDPTRDESPSSFPPLVLSPRARVPPIAVTSSRSQLSRLSPSESDPPDLSESEFDPITTDLASLAEEDGDNLFFEGQEENDD